MKNTLVIYCKSYHGDLERAKLLHKSIQKFNEDKLPFYMSVPKADLKLFESALGTDDRTIQFLTDEEIMDGNYPNDWYAQMMVKASFCKTGLSDIYLCVDSDSYFIKPFYLKDFMHDDVTPYTVMHECKDLLQLDAKYRMGVKQRFEEARKKVMGVYGRKGRAFDYGTPPFIFDCSVWNLWHNEVLPELGITINEAMRDYGEETVWYGETLLAKETIKLVPIEPLFKFFHYPLQYNDYKLKQGITQEMIAQNYMGIVMQSNWNAPLLYE